MHTGNSSYLFLFQDSILHCQMFQVLLVVWRGHLHGGDHVLPVPPVAQGHQEGGTLASYGCGGISHRFVNKDFDRFC